MATSKRKPGDAPILAFPRDMTLVNDTAMPWVIGGKFVPASSSVAVNVDSEDHLTRYETDCGFIIDLSDHYKPAPVAEGEEPAPLSLRLVEIDPVVAVLEPAALAPATTEPPAA